MDKAKPINISLTNHFKLSKSLYPLFGKEIEELSSVSYSLAVGSLMYTMICMRFDIAHAVITVSQLLFNLGKTYWKAVKWILLINSKVNS